MCYVIVNPNGRVLYASQCTLYTNMITRNFQLKFYLQHLLSPEFLGLYEFTDHYIYNVFWFDPYSQFSAYIFLFTRYWCNFKMLFISLSHVISSKTIIHLIIGLSFIMVNSPTSSPDMLPTRQSGKADTKIRDASSTELFIQIPEPIDKMYSACSNQAHTKFETNNSSNSELDCNTTVMATTTTMTSSALSHSSATTTATRDSTSPPVEELHQQRQKRRRKPEGLICFYLIDISAVIWFVFVPLFMDFEKQKKTTTLQYIYYIINA